MVSSAESLNNFLRGKRILLMAPRYHYYEHHIEKGLQQLGGDVLFLENKAFKYDPLNKGTAWYEQWACSKNNYLHDQILPALKQPFDICFFVDLFSFHPIIIQTLRKKNPDVQCMLYLWDNVRDYKWPQFFQYFDKVFTFDPVEADELNIQYFPNFYPDVNVERTTPIYNACFIGSLQVHRLKILSRIVEELKGTGHTFFYLYLPPHHNRFKYNALNYFIARLFPSRFQGYKRLYKLIHRKITHELVFHEPLNLVEAIKKMSQAKCILDFPFPTQTGSTQRVIQALALNKKVITTNPSIVKEPFYNPDFIKVVPFDDFEIDWNWINEDTKATIDMSYLRIDNWLRKLFAEFA